MTIPINEIIDCKRVHVHIPRSKSLNGHTSSRNRSLSGSNSYKTGSSGGEGAGIDEENAPF